MNGAAVFCQDAQGRVLMGCRAAGPMIGCWVLPGGHMEPGESARDAACREFREETGCAVSVHPVAEHHEHMVHRVKRRIDQEDWDDTFRIVYFFRACGFESGAQDADGEFSAVEWFTADQAHAAKLTPTIRRALLTLWPEFERAAEVGT